MKSIFLLCEYNIPILTVMNLYNNDVTIEMINQSREYLDSVVGRNGAKSEQILKAIEKINENDKQYSVYDLIIYGLSKGIVENLYSRNISIDDINNDLQEKYHIGDVTYSKIKTAYNKLICESKKSQRLTEKRLYFLIRENYSTKYFKFNDLQNLLYNNNYSTEDLNEVLVELLNNKKIKKCGDEYYMQYLIDELQNYGLSSNIADYLKGLDIGIEDIDYSIKSKYHITDARFDKIMEAYNKMIYSGNVYVRINKEKLYEYIKDNFGSKVFFKDELLNKLNSSHYIVDNIDDMISELICNKKIKKVNGGYALRYPNLIDELNKISKVNNRRDIILRKLSGQNFEQIGKVYGLTRERIRQVYSRELNRLPVVEEDELAGYFKKYNFTIDVFTKLFKVDNCVYYYLKDKYGMGESDVSELLDDSSLSDEQIRILRKEYNMICYNDENIVATKNSLLVAYLKKVGKSVEYEELMENYNKIVREYKLPLELLTSDDARNIDAILGRSDYVLNTLGKYYRYFDINDVDENDKEELRELLNVEPGIYSSELFFNDNSLLMKRIDIRDEYELHNLMKRFFGENDKNIVFSRMPNICINCNNKDEFFKSKIEELSPISIDDFSNYIYINYGHKVNSFKSYILSKLTKYINSNILISDCPEFNDEQAERMKIHLKEDIYSINSVKVLLKELFDVSDYRLINNLNFSKIGYKIRGNYVMKSDISNVELYFKQQIMNEDYFIIKPEYKKIGSTFSSYLYKFIYAKLIFKIDNDMYITINKLNKMGIYESDINGFIDEISRGIPNDDYFNLYTLNTDFSNKLFEFNFPNSFYETIIMTIPEVKTFTLKNNTLFIKTNNAATREKFINSFVDNDKKYIQEIKQEILKKYNIELEEYYIREFINRKRFYFDRENDCIYKMELGCNN